MRIFFRIVFSLFILLPCLLLGYQNCSNFEKDNNSTATSFIGHPVFLNDLNLIGYRQPTGCSNAPVSEPSSYNSVSHLCAQARTACESAFLREKNFLITEAQNCNEITDPTETDFLSSLKTVNISDLGFRPQNDQVCSFQFAAMIHFGLRNCVTASNGCEIGFLADKGFLSDQTNLCSF